MAQRFPYLSVRPYLGHALAATTAVVLVPAAVAFVYARGGGVALPIVLLASLVLMIVAGAIGGFVWSRSGPSRDIAFGELIFWRWFQRARAEDRIEEGAEALVVGPTGELKVDPSLTPQEQVDLLRTLARALEVKDPYTHGHSRRVERHARRTAAELRLSDDEIDEVGRAAALHDVGKLLVPDRVLRKPETLSASERQAVQEHSGAGEALVAAVGSRSLAQAVRHHHERWDGLGYPDHIGGRQIPLYARIIAVCDAYDAMVSTRPYRPSLGHGSAIEELRGKAGAQFDPQVVEAFIATMPARVPAAAMLPFLVFPTHLLRQVAVPMRRLALGELSTGVAAVGAAVILGTAFAPPVPIDRGPVDRVVEDRAGRPDVARRTFGDSVAGRRVERRVIEVRARASAPRSARGTSRPEAAPRTRIAEPKNKPRPATPAAPAVVPPDPHPELGRDCRDHPGRGRGGGISKHCG